MDRLKLLPVIIFVCLLLAHQSRSLPVRGQNAAATTPTIRDRLSTTESSAGNSIDGTSLTCPDSYQKYYCLNGSKCFLVNTGISYEYNCECTNGFLGHRCQFKHATNFEIPEKEYSAEND